MTLNLSKPSANTVGWAATINQNFTDIESAVNAGPWVRVLSQQWSDDADYLSYTVPGGTLGVGDLLEIRGSGIQQGSAPDSDVRLTIGGLTMVEKLNPGEDTVLVVRGLFFVRNPADQPVYGYTGYFGGELVGYGDKFGTGTPFSVGVSQEGHVIDWSANQVIRWESFGVDASNRIRTLVVWHHRAP